MTVKELFNRQLTGLWTTSGKDVQWRYGQVEGINLLEFQCTSTADDWIENIKFWPHTTKDIFGVYIHDGFCEMFESVLDDLRYGMSEVDAGDNLLITGYSQGAALATLAAYYFRSMGINVKLVTFGCPRLFWGIVSKYVKDWIGGTHYAVRGDIVTHLPPAILGYSRGGKGIRIGPKSMIKVAKHEPVNYQNYLPDTEV